MIIEMKDWPTPAEFLARFWQKQPLLIRGAIPEVTNIITPEELAGMACLTEVESRLVVEHGSDRPWQVTHGPFDESDFSNLPETNWTLLVQRVDRLVAQVAMIGRHFAFLPNWRFDDVMISYAAPQGSVGPHTDLYDVFLVQGKGKREWRLRVTPEMSPKFIPDLDLRILSDFRPDQVLQVEPGDLLYLPPGFAHYGIALEECMTFSVGLRAPSYRQLLLAFTQEIADILGDEDLYADPDLPFQKEPGLISEQTLQHFENWLKHKLFDENRFREWLGRYLTRPIEQGQEADPITLDTQILQGDFARREGGRFSYTIDEAKINLFVEGEQWRLGSHCESFVTLLCRQHTFRKGELKTFLEMPEVNKLWEELMKKGFVYSIKPC